MTEVGIDGPDDVGHLVGVVHAGTHILVDDRELVERHTLVVVHLYHPLAAHHLFDEAVDDTEVLLAFGEVLLGNHAQLAGDPEDEQRKGHADHRKCRAHHYHGRQRSDYGDKRAQYARDALGNDLPEGIDVVGIHAHDLAVGMVVEVAERELLHVAEEFPAELVQRPVPDVDHEYVVDVGSYYAYEQYGSEPQHRSRERGIVGRALLHHGSDVGVDEGLGEEVGGKRRERSDYYADDHERYAYPVVPEHEAEESPDSLGDLPASRHAVAGTAELIHPPRHRSRPPLRWFEDRRCPCRWYWTQGVPGGSRRR